MAYSVRVWTKKKVSISACQSFCSIIHIGSMYGTFPCIWLICLVAAGKYTIHGSLWDQVLLTFSFWPSVCTLPKCQFKSSANFLLDKNWIESMVISSDIMGKSAQQTFCVKIIAQVFSLLWSKPSGWAVRNPPPSSTNNFNQSWAILLPLPWTKKKSPNA